MNDSMNGNLIKTVIAASSGTNIDELKNFSTQLYQFYFDRKESTREAIEKSVAWIPPPLRGIFKPKLARANEKEQLTDLRAIAEQERQLLALFFGTELQYAKLSSEKLIASKLMTYDTELQGLGAEHKARLTAFCSQKREEIEAVLERAINDHSQRQVRLMCLADQFSNDEDYQHQLIAHIRFLSKSFMDTQVNLLSQFYETLNFKLQSIPADYSSRS